MGIGVGLQQLHDLGPIAAHGAREVADLRRGGDDLGLARRGATAVRRAPGDEQRQRSGRQRGGGGPARGQHAARGDRGEDAAGEHGDRGPGRRVELDRQPQPGHALDGDEGDGRHLPGAQARAQQPRGGRRDDEQGGGQQGAERRQRGDADQRHQGEQHDVGQRRARAERARGAWIEAGRQPALLEHEPAGDDDHRADGGEDVVAGVDQQQAAEEQRLDAAGGVEDVAGEDDADRQRGDEDERRERVVAVARPLAAGQQADRDRHEGRGRPGAEDGGEAEAPGQHEPREGGGADRVGVEGQPAQDDPGADQSPGHGEDQHLDDPVLDEGQLERLEHPAASLQE